MDYEFPFPKPGFTLIELLVVTSIMGILFALGIAGYNEFNRQQILDQATKQVKSDLRLAQQKALIGEKPTNCTGSLRGYLVFIGPNSSLYKLYAVCSIIIPIKDSYFPQNVTTSGSMPVTQMTFKVLAQGVEIWISPGGQVSTATITLTAFGGKTKKITVTAGGEIN